MCNIVNRNQANRSYGFQENRVNENTSEVNLVASLVRKHLEETCPMYLEDNCRIIKKIIDNMNWSDGKKLRVCKNKITEYLKAVGSALALQILEELRFNKFRRIGGIK